MLQKMQGCLVKSVYLVRFINSQKFYLAIPAFGFSFEGIMYLQTNQLIEKSNELC